MSNEFNFTSQDLEDHLREEIDILKSFNQLVSSGAKKEQIVETVIREAAFRLATNAILLLLIDESGKNLIIEQSFGLSEEIEQKPIPLKGTQMGRIVELGGILSVPNLAIHKGFEVLSLIDQDVNCVHFITLEIENEKIGVLCLGYHQQKFLNDKESKLVETLSKSAAVALKNSYNQCKLQIDAAALEKIVQERTAELALQTERADEANRAKSEFIANISHELRTPLTSIIGYSSIITQGIFGDVNKEQLEALDTVGKSAEHLKDLIEDILKVSKVEAGKEDFDPKPIDIINSIKQVYKLVAQSAMSKGIKLDSLELLEEDKDLLKQKLWADPRHLRQILINLISNAIKYTPTGGHVWITTEFIADKMKISVHDSGIGISEDNRKQLFERFQRIDDKYAKSQIGTGLGLSITKNLVEINGGLIGVDSEIDKGSEFWIMLPIFNEGNLNYSQNISQTEDWHNIELKGMNILITEDNKATADVLKTILENSGASTAIAEDVSVAKRLVNETYFDAILVDLALPKVNGQELISYIRNNKHKNSSNVPIIVVSACVFEQNQKEAKEKGANDFVKKPFLPSEVLLSIKNETFKAMIEQNEFDTK
ncbi:MAG: response regulator [Proteobacteria bacterium]|nr:response regulator [Pseudomonadota bacterium]